MARQTLFRQTRVDASIRTLRRRAAVFYKHGAAPLAQSRLACNRIRAPHNRRTRRRTEASAFEAVQAHPLRHQGARRPGGRQSFLNRRCAPCDSLRAAALHRKQIP
ncbi:hypothetical protein [Burkholderia ambifaria]|uniref:hypothetical protein n=1 Tax=Burkholderia ambifaria TaxID=152480 RepID=UPI0012FE3AD0|nr:hypothetical protein [Burkholderia ambifaria]